MQMLYTITDALLYAAAAAGIAMPVVIFTSEKTAITLAKVILRRYYIKTGLRAVEAVLAEKVEDAVEVEMLRTMHKFACGQEGIFRELGERGLYDAFQEEAGDRELAKKGKVFPAWPKEEAEGKQ